MTGRSTGWASRGRGLRPADRQRPTSARPTRRWRSPPTCEIDEIIGRVRADRCRRRFTPAMASCRRTRRWLAPAQAPAWSFVGPPPEASELMGDKLRAKERAQRPGIPVVPSSQREPRREPPPTPCWSRRPPAAAAGHARRAAAEELDAALQSARREAKAGFGDDRVFIERFLPRARHIEVQVLADAHGTVLHLGERECSLQRRHQKVIEESPSPVVIPRLRAAARRGGGDAGPCRRLRQRRHGRVHRRLLDDPAEHYFLEMNARLQVEHPVTELVTGLDLVEQQLRVAAGEPLALGPGRDPTRRSRDRSADHRRGRDQRLPAHRRPRARVSPAARGPGRRRDRGRQRDRHRL